MNTELLATIRDWLLTDDLAPGGFDFDMSAWIAVETQPEDTWRGTCCCIAGAALIFSDYTLVDETLSTLVQGFADDQPFHWSYNVESLAAHALGINSYIAEQLFMYPAASRHHAAQTINHLIKTGEVQWTL